MRAVLDAATVDVAAQALHVVVPGDVDDPARPSGGNVYDRLACRALRREVRELAVDGTWPRPDDHARLTLARTLAALPGGSDVLLDGLVACGVPEVVVPHARRLRLTVLVHLPLGDEVGLPPATAAALTVLERATLRVAAVVATSPWTARRIAQLHRLPAGRVGVAAPGVDPAPLAVAEEPGGRLLCVGSITPTKGQDLLVAALARVADREWTCPLVGPLGRDRSSVDAVRGLVARHGLGGRVQLTGPLTGPALDAAYAATDLLVVPSRAETYGMVVTEALARGIPVLAAAAGGLPETLGRAPDGARPGLLVPPGDPAALAAELSRWLDDPWLRSATRTAARRRRSELDGWDVTARHLARALR